MAIDSRRKRASIASLGLAFLGASIVPDGSFAQGDRQTIGNSYYGIDAAVPIVQIGGTSQLEAFDATGGITIELVIGGTSQIEAFTSSGVITAGAEVEEGGGSAGKRPHGGYIPQPRYTEPVELPKDLSDDELAAIAMFVISELYD